MSDLSRVFDRALGAYLGLAIGDALGATVEFMRPREIALQYGVHRDVIGGGWLKLQRGQVTDDTTMSLALGDALVAAGPQALRRHVDAGDTAAVSAMANAFVRWMRNKPVDCGHTCRRGIQRYIGNGSLFAPPNEGDAGNGALMRNLPVVLATLGAPHAFEALSIAQARITHHHTLSDQATLGIGRLVQDLVLGAGHEHGVQWAREWTAQHRKFAFEPYPGRASAYVVDTVQTVLHFFTQSADFETAVIATVNQGDDADTTGALVGMLAGAVCGASALPYRWIKPLQAGLVGTITDQTSHLLSLGAVWETPSRA